MSLAVDLRRRCDEVAEATEDGGAVGEEKTEIEESDPIDDVGEKGRRGGGVEGMDFKVGSKGELDGEVGKRVSLIGKVKARGVGEMMDTIGGGGASVDTSRAARGKSESGREARGECAAADGRAGMSREDLLRAEASRVR